MLNIANATVVWPFYPETGGIPPEKIDTLFTDQGGLDPSEEKLAFYKKLQWNVVEAEP